MLMGLQDMGCTHCFDAVYGASAGAINSTYFLTGQPEGLDIYTDYLATTSRFLSLKRYWGRTSVMDLDYLIDEIMHEVTPLDWQAVIDSELPLKVVASSLSSLRSEILSDFTSQADLVECLKASANVPEIVGGPRHHRGHQLVDAAVFEPLPVKAALRDGCTHVLALCSRPHRMEPAWSRYISAVLTNGIKYWLLNPPYMRDAWRVEPLHQTHRGEPFDDHLLQLWLQGKMLELESDISPESRCSSSSTDCNDSGSESESAMLTRGILGGHVYPVYPGAAASFAPVCTHVPTLQAGRQEGYRSVHKLWAALERMPAQLAV
jgi:predicted acylesterase/phospholipase RssA